MFVTLSDFAYIMQNLQGVSWQWFYPISLMWAYNVQFCGYIYLNRVFVLSFAFF